MDKNYSVIKLNMLINLYIIGYLFMDIRFVFLARLIFGALLLGFVACTPKRAIDYQLPNTIGQGASVGGVAGLAIGAGSLGGLSAGIVAGGIGGAYAGS